MKKGLFFITILALLILPAHSTAFADKDGNEGDYPWQAHAAPFYFQFGNMIDTHQQSKLSKKENLHGFIYIHYTGEFTTDGIPIARKANCEIEACSVGWVIKGVPFQGTLVNKGPRIWLIDPSNLPKETGYTHFQWIGSPKKPHGLILNNTYEGYLLKRVAVVTFYWLGGSGEGGQGGGRNGGGCSGGDHPGDGCSGDDHTDEGGCSGDDYTGGGCSGGDGSSGHGGRLVVEGLDAHSNVVTSLGGYLLSQEGR